MTGSGATPSAISPFQSTTAHLATPMTRPISPHMMSLLRDGAVCLVGGKWARGKWRTESRHSQSKPSREVAFADEK